MSVNKALENILEGKLDEMRTNFSNALAVKAVEKLEERKIEIAQSYFGQVDEEKVDESIAAQLAGTAAGLGLSVAGMKTFPKLVDAASKLKKKLSAKKKK